jgi:hypothetical protein
LVNVNTNVVLVTGAVGDALGDALGEMLGEGDVGVGDVGVGEDVCVGDELGIAVLPQALKLTDNRMANANLAELLIPPRYALIRAIKTCRLYSS